MVLKILLEIRKYFTKHKNEKFTRCLFCGKQLTNRQRKFCSDNCNGKYHRTKHKPSNKLNNAKLRRKYMENIKGFRDQCLVRNKSTKFKKLNGNCYMCEIRRAEDTHHPDYNKPELIYPLCKHCHRKHHSLLLLQRRKK